MLSPIVLFPHLLCSAEDVTKEKVDALVAQLVSPNKAPEIPSASARYPAGYDRKAQEKVYETFFSLQKLGPPAFPYLIEHFGDKRYSFTDDAGSAARNWSVGAACYDVVRYQLQPDKTWRGLGKTPRPSYPGHIKLHDPKSAKHWWETHKGKSLRELQTEALEWIIAEETHMPEKYDDEETSSLRDLLKTLRAEDKPLDPGVPWAR
ncbi:MAG: hypothetical protein IT428_20840 [Planctomycetaceae bacterium]|nr:hypothetical protein [Planctomycetaceae bacterium]